MSALKLSPSRLDLEIYRGDDFALAVNFVDDANQPVDVTANAYAATITNIDTGASITTATASVAGSIVTIAIGHASMASVPSRAMWKLTENASGVVTTIFVGTLAVADEVTA